MPTKNLPFSGLGPATIAGAPSHLTLTFTLLELLPDNMRFNSSKKAIAFLPPSKPLLIMSSSDEIPGYLNKKIYADIDIERTLVKKDETLAVIDRRKKVIGTYIHGWFESKEVSERLLSLLTGKEFKVPVSFSEIKDREMDELAIFIEKHCDVEKILQN